MTAIAVANFPDFKLLIVDRKILVARKGYVWAEKQLIKIIPLDTYGFSSIGDGIFLSHTKEYAEGRTFDYKSNNDLDDYLNFINTKKQELNKHLIDIDKFEEKELPPLFKSHLFFIDNFGIYTWRIMADYTTNKYIRWQHSVRPVPDNSIEIYYGDNFYSLPIDGITPANIETSIISKIEHIHATIPVNAKFKYDFDNKFNGVYFYPGGDTQSIAT